MTKPTERQRAEAFARGVDRGWSHANFCTAYAPWQTHCDPTDTEAPRHDPTFADFLRGWHEGIRRFLGDQDPDTTTNKEN